MHTNLCVLIEISIEIGMLNFWDVIICLCNSAWNKLYFGKPSRQYVFTWKKNVIPNTFQFIFSGVVLLTNAPDSSSITNGRVASELTPTQMTYARIWFQQLLDLITLKKFAWKVIFFSGFLWSSKNKWPVHQQNSLWLEK